MKEDVWLIGIVFVVWGVLSLMYFTIPMIHMPVTGRVWGLGALIFLALASFVALAQYRGRDRRQH